MPRPTLKQDLIEYFVAAVTFQAATTREFLDWWDSYTARTDSSYSTLIEQLSEAGRALALAVHERVFKRKPYKEYDPYMTEDAFIVEYVKLVLTQDRFPTYGELAVLAKQSVVLI